MKNFIRYLCVGAVNTLVWLISMIISRYFYDNYLFYTATGYLTSLFVSFILNLRFTFKVSGEISKRIRLFFIINLCNLVIVEIIQKLLIDQAQFSEPSAIGAGILWYTFTGYWMNQRFVFNIKQSAR